MEALNITTVFLCNNMLKKQLVYMIVHKSKYIAVLVYR